MMTKVLNDRQIRWSETLSQYDLKIEYQPGKEGGKPDTLTRRTMDMPEENDKRITQKQRILLPKEQYFEAMKVTKIHNNLGAIQEASKNDQDLQEIRKALEERTKEMKGVALGR